MESDHLLHEQLRAKRAELQATRTEQAAQAELAYVEGVLVAASPERAILDSATEMRKRIIELQAKHLRASRIATLGRRVMRRGPLPDLRFGMDDEEILPGHYLSHDLTVETAPLLASEDSTPEATVAYGWVFRLQSRQPGAILSHGKILPPHHYARYENSSLRIYRSAEDRVTGLQAKELWFSIDEEGRQPIYCWQLARERQSAAGYKYSGTPDDDYQADEVTSLHLLGILQASLEEIS
ncbi:MAG: hypothetical protein JWN38_1142 [Candidatus Saccharibacteria bacterium]|nr:hypothetical protein [Candidatus Saccharibacteria bacterium]